MADISTYLQKIMSAIYGEEVRGSIHDAIAAMNAESSRAMEYAATARDSARASAASAQTSAALAEQKAGESASSAQAARTSEANAKASENNAVRQASDTAAAAARAKASETSAAGSEAAAAQKAQEAADAQAAAALSEAEAKAAAERTQTLRSEVQTIGEQAAADRAAAQTARDEALSSQNAANAAKDAAQLASDAAKAAKDTAELAMTGAKAAKDTTELAMADAKAASDIAEEAADNAAQAAASADASARSAMQYSGKPPKPQDGTWRLWDADTQQYVDSGITCELRGPAGNGIQDIQCTKGDHSPGTTDIYTVAMTDGSAVSIPVYNGRDGEGTGDVLGIEFELELPVSGWNGTALTAEDSRLLARNKYRYLISAHGDSRVPYQAAGVEAGDITQDGLLTFTCLSVPDRDLTVSVTRLELAGHGEG